MTQHIEKVIWKDHCDACSTGWHSLDDVDYSCRIISSVGFVLRETEDILTLAQHLDKSENFVSNVTNILKSDIVRRHSYGE